MLKNFSPQGLGITGRQSELIELALTYAFRGIEVNMMDMLKRCQRTSFDDAAKYLRAAEIAIGSFDAGIDLDVDDDTFAGSLAQVHPLAELAEQLNASLATLRLPAATDLAAFPEFFEKTSQRVKEVAAILAQKEIRLALSFTAGKDKIEGKNFPFVNTVEAFLAFVKSVSSDQVGFVVDTWDWPVGGGAIEQIKALPPSQVFVIRLGDLVPGVAIAEAKTSDRVLPKAGDGFDHVGLLKHFAAAGVEAVVMPTASSAQNRDRTREATVNEAQEAIDAIFTEAGLPVPPKPIDLVASIPYEPTPMN